MKKRFALFLLLFLVLQGTHLHAQVTIGFSDTVPTGADVAPVYGALLQLKENESKDNNTTRGLVMPRVKLTNKNELYPMFLKAGSDIETDEYAMDKAALKATHAGLMVYNLTPDGGFCPGLYVWDGEQWQKLGKKCP